MRRPKNKKYPWVRKNIVKGRIYWRFEKNGFRCNLPGPYGSPEFDAAYEAALEHVQLPRSKARPDTIGWLIEQLYGSLRFRGHSPTRKSTLRGQLDWIKLEAGDLPFARMEVEHVEALMAKKEGPAAANTVKKNLSMLYNFASRKLRYKGHNPARDAEKMKENPDGYHTWTDAEIQRFLDYHGPKSKAGLALLLALNTGMARKDLCGPGRHMLRRRDGKRRIVYARSKTGVEADLPLLPELEDALKHIPIDQHYFLPKEGSQEPYVVESFGNWFRDKCVQAGVPGSIHGLRKAGAARLALAGATENEIAAFLAHTDTSQASTYTKAANRSKLADSGFARLKNLSNSSELLDSEKE